MLSMKSTIRLAAAVLAAVFCLALLPVSAFAETIFGRDDLDREYQNPDTGFMARILDTEKRLTDEEKEKLMSALSPVTQWCDVSVLVTDMTREEFDYEDGLWRLLRDGEMYVFLMISGKEKEPLISCPPLEDEIISTDDLEEIDRRTTEVWRKEHSASACAEAFAASLLQTLEKSGWDGMPRHNEKYYYFSSVKTLRDILSIESGEEIWALGRGIRDYFIDEDLTIPSGFKVFFGRGKVSLAPEAVVTVEDLASLFYYEMDVRGVIENRGDLVQQSPEDGVPVLLSVKGGIMNSGWLSYYKAEGLDKIQDLGGGLTYSETEGLSDETPPTVEPPKEDKEEILQKPNLNPGILESILQRMQYALRRVQFALRRTFRDKNALTDLFVAIFIALAVVVAILKRKREKERETPPPTRRAETGGRAAFSTDEALTEDQKRRVAHLDDWLKSGLIDRKEYQILKARYMNRK